MFWAIFSIIINNVSNVFFKKTTEYKINSVLNDLLSHIGWIIWIIILIIIWRFTVELNNYITYFLVIITFLLYLIDVKLHQFVVSREKISTLVPYDNIWIILTVIFWVFVLGEKISWVSLIIFWLLIITIIWFSIDFKSLKFSKNILLFLFSKTIVAIANLLMWYILINNAWLSYFIVYVLISLSLTTIICFIWWYFKDLKILDKTYYENRFLSSFWWVTWIISILLIEDLWLSITTMLWFLWIWVTLITSYLLFKDIPTKKDIILTVLVTIWVTLWFYFK